MIAPLSYLGRAEIVLLIRQTERRVLRFFAQCSVTVSPTHLRVRTRFRLQWLSLGATLAEIRDLCSGKRALRNTLRNEYDGPAHQQSNFFLCYPHSRANAGRNSSFCRSKNRTPGVHVCASLASGVVEPNAAFWRVLVGTGGGGQGGGTRTRPRSCPDSRRAQPIALSTDVDGRLAIQ